MLERFVFASAPSRVYWEITRSCDLACRHCRAEAAPHCDPGELDTEAGLRLLHQLAAASPQPHVIFTGGDPLKRADLFQLIATARELGMGVSVSPSATPLLTDEAITKLKEAGVEAISLSLDGADAVRHDDIRRVPGCFERTLRAGRKAREVGLAFQVNTLVSQETVDDMPAIEQLARSIGASRWSLFFLVTVGRGTVLNPISGERAEELLTWLAQRAREPGMVLTTTEAPHYRRIVMEQRMLHPENGPPRSQKNGDGHGPPHPHAHPHAAGAGIRDGNGVMFIDNEGEIFPSGFLQVSAGNVKVEDPIFVYQNAPLFQVLRAAESFGGRCGHCTYRAVCGGSRARAWAATGDPLAEDPLCTYKPLLHAQAHHPVEAQRL
ncbi:MAG: TIGR04053 family radical SAM/SPASM domain-containing protein [Byssovorax sp.]